MKRRSRPHSHLTALQAGLSEVLGEDQLKRLADIGRIRRDWAKIVGPVLSQHTEPLNIDNGCLHVAVDHPAMAQQMRFLHEEIREACFKQCRVTGISNIRTRHQPGAGMPSRSHVTLPLHPLSLSDKKAVAREVHQVHNKALRRAMFEARINQLRHQPPVEA
ncbi:MAG: DUF721 domain-containing protein [Zetaproteobacteria bacterium CG12_big_fil_rev_8_21_14_0_65_55_1124]|nr:MAG: hypothetical protein AUJ58_02345 [Zetaproteobacteria bacterium CG1_02_55_237]PIS19057.1 MAG: DUF721 domain-containing protein [Zetaproteobacteria bacterium CG08_land_8_20_14_0_20_55_17]PIW41837.1 MAG: DUF721 domain-containing protein [Zetaproteobacteria bacterium CG12_big_fil_rev_8_21_14_0_65_55_1124]PIY54074.1 MAG: DUF721 domain-containing protein [Zetaproteobacteria bacterium CG_4_10_14_0_8_um_filter_55_43]PIZ40249.1 MAG: DUF721 domain-containing protein [Zetaproteobacteria bacterium 